MLSHFKDETKEDFVLESTAAVDEKQSDRRYKTLPSILGSLLLVFWVRLTVKSGIACDSSSSLYFVLHKKRRE